MKEKTGASDNNFDRPLRQLISRITIKASTMPPAFETSSLAAFRLPPVASKSSTIRTL